MAETPIAFMTVNTVTSDAHGQPHVHSGRVRWRVMQIIRHK
jgi:hypothetical protein